MKRHFAPILISVIVLLAVSAQLEAQQPAQPPTGPDKTATDTGHVDKTNSAGEKNAQEQDSNTQSTVDEIALKLADPNTTLGTLNFNWDYISYKGDLPGANDQSAYKMTFQPILPYPISEGVNFYLRPAVPIIFKQNVPVTNPDGTLDYRNSHIELGDIGFDAAIGKTHSNGMIVVAGMQGSLKTATDDALGTRQWLLGPELLVGYGAKWGFASILVGHLWDVAGTNDYSTNLTTGQYFYTIALKNGWQFGASPTFSYNHNGPKDSKWTLPLGVGIRKTTIFNGQPWKFALEYWQYVKQADEFGPDYQVRFVVTPVVPLPWGKK